MTGDVVAYVNANFERHHREIFECLRELMGQNAPHARLVISRGSPAWTGRSLLAIISRSKTHLTLAFGRGAAFTDRHNLLEGTGKTTRHIKIKTAEGINKQAIADYIRQATELDLR
ncbi:DUF1801 domain-containing protein [Dactylosporangium sp. NPDC000521]|uniref:DUF1801 domain-containing protein n=1 Tax=Dactylosporangium sp. NPDC000521 TaxID=3363975 RepID=UPI0036C0866E